MPKRRKRDPQTSRILYTVAVAACVTLGGIAVSGAYGGRDGGAAHAHGRRQGETPDPKTMATPPVVEATPAVPAPPDAAKPDEMGRFPILMYHSIGDPPLTGSLARFNHLGLSISAATFRKHLEMLRSDGFYPVNMRDALSPEIDVPRGLTPVVLTFDDAREAQFRIHKDGSIDPNCAIGVLAAFHDRHPDWPERATFYVLPKSQYNPTPFGQAKYEKQKIAYLIAHGYEIANHSTSHHPMSHMDATRLAWEMTYCQDYFHHLAPDAPPMSTMALPYGIAPAKSLLSVLLGDGKTKYHNDCILMAAGGESFAPGDKRFNRLALPRAGSEPGYIEACITRLHAARLAKTPFSAHGNHPYVSDGDPLTFSIPKSAMPFVDKLRLGDTKLLVYADTTPKPVTHTVAAKLTKNTPKG